MVEALPVPLSHAGDKSWDRHEPSGEDCGEHSGEARHQMVR